MNKKTIGIVLLVLGLLGFFVDDLSFTTEEEKSIGPLDVQVEERNEIPTGPAISGLLVAGGVVLLVLDYRE